jgi:Flp pilus assembly protein TadD
MHQYEAAFADCDAALAIAPDNVNTRMFRAIAALGAGKLDLAKNDFTEILRNRPNDWTARFGMALARLKSGEREEAETELAKVRKIAPSAPNFFKKYGIQ